MKAIGICGLGGSGRELCELINRINDNRWEEIVFIDKETNDNRRRFEGRKIYTFEEIKEVYPADEIEFTVSVGDVFLREKIYKQIKDAGFFLATLIAPGVHVPKSTVLGEGAILRENCFISVDTRIKENAMIQPNAAIGHDVVIGEHSIVSANSSVAGNVSIGHNTYIALNCAIKETVEIGSRSIIAMGSMVNRKVEDNVIVAGNPAKVISKNYLRSAFRLHTGTQQNG